jgi:hypothetical protein
MTKKIIDKKGYRQAMYHANHIKSFVKKSKLEKINGTRKNTIK